MRNTALITSLLVLLLLPFFGGGPLQAQQPGGRQNPFVSNTDLVVTWANITNPSDQSPVRGLGADDLLLREEGKLQQIGFVKQGQPLSVVMLVDGMSSCYPGTEFRRSREALRQLGEDAEIASMAWDSDVRLVQPLTRDHNVIADQLEDRARFFHALNGPGEVARPERDSYRPGEAIYQAARYLEQAALAGRRKIIIVITRYGRGMRMAQTHPHTDAEVEGLLKKTGTTVYVLYEGDLYGRGPGYDDVSPASLLIHWKDKQRQRGGGTLEQAMSLTGGSSLGSKKIGDDGLLIKLTGLIGSSYTIGYYPHDTNFDGRFRRIDLVLSRGGKTRASGVGIKTRGGYHAIRPAASW